MLSLRGPRDRSRGRSGPALPVASRRRPQPVGRQPAGNAGADAEQVLRASALEAHRHPITLLRNDGILEPFTLPVLLRFAGLVRAPAGAAPARASAVRFPLRKKFGERLLDFGGVVRFFPGLEAARAASSTDTSTFTTSSARFRTQSGTVSRTRTPVVEAMASFSDLDVLDVDRGDDVDAGVERPPGRLRYRFWCVEPGALVCASSSMTAICGLPRQDRVEVHFPEGHAPVLDVAAAARLFTSPIIASVSARPCASTKPTTTSSPCRCSACASSSILITLAHPGRGADVDTQPRAALLLAFAAATRRSKGGDRP